MEKEERTALLTRAIRTYGEQAQIDMAIEEMADVQIMLDQLRIIFQRSTEESEDGKIDRLKRRLDRHDGIDQNNGEGWRGSMLHTFLNRQGGGLCD